MNPEKTVKYRVSYWVTGCDPLKLYIMIVESIFWNKEGLYLRGAAVEIHKRRFVGRVKSSFFNRWYLIGWVLGCVTHRSQPCFIFFNRKSSIPLLNIPPFGQAGVAFILISIWVYRFGSCFVPFSGMLNTQNMFPLGKVYLLGKIMVTWPCRLW